MKNESKKTRSIFGLKIGLRKNISLHIKNIFKEGELVRKVVVKEYLTTTQHGAVLKKTQKHLVKLYNLDVIISVGYRVKSKHGTQFRIWATNMLREHLLRGYTINHRIEKLEHRMQGVENKVNFFVRTTLPPVEGVYLKFM